MGIRWDPRGADAENERSRASGREEVLRGGWRFSRKGPALGMPAGFVNTVKSKGRLAGCPASGVRIAGRRGGSAPAALHAIMRYA